MLLVLISLVFQSASFCQVPVILYQPSEVEVCAGEQLIIDVLTDNCYTYQWFTADFVGGNYLNLREIQGQDSASLILNKVSGSSDTKNIYFFLRIVNNTDTVWSEGIHVIILLTDRAVHDTVLVNAKTGLMPLSLPLFFADPVKTFLWSTGDTTSYAAGDKYIVFHEQGKHWVTSEGYGCSRTDTFIVTTRPAFIHIKSVGTKHQIWNADTVFIENNIILDSGLTVLPGTVVQFQGNYSLTADFIHADGLDKDSIYFIGGRNYPLIQEGNIHSVKVYTGVYDIDNIIRNVKFKKLREISLSNVADSEFDENYFVHTWDPKRCYIHSNARVEFCRSIRNCILSDNDTISGFAASPRGGPQILNCHRNIFRSNTSGLSVNGNINSAIYISLNFFVNNASTAIQARFPETLFVDQNVFVGNGSYDSPSVFKSMDYIEPYSSFYSSFTLYFRNNTVYGNHGISDFELISPDTINLLHAVIMNNIFCDKENEGLNIMFSRPVRGIISNNSFSRIKQESINFDTSSFQLSGNLFNTEPSFEDTAGLLFSLKANSALIDAGSDSVFKLERSFTSDFNDLPRKIGRAVDIGAYEYFDVTPNAFAYITPDTMVCMGKQNRLKVLPVFEPLDQEYVFKWYRNGNVLPDSLQGKHYLKLPNYTDPSGYYHVMVSGLSDTVWTKPILVTTQGIPFISDQPLSVSICEGQDAAFAVHVDGNLDTRYEWFSKKLGKLASDSGKCYIQTVKQSDLVYAEISNTCGSIVTDSAELLLFPVPFLELGEDLAISPGDSILLDAGNDFETYRWSNGNNTQHIYGHAGDTVMLEVTDIHSCSASDTIVISSIPITNNLSGKLLNRFNVYPNPATDILFIETPEPSHCIVKIMTLDGKLLSEVHHFHEKVITIDVSALPKGAFLVFMQTRSDIEVAKFIVQ